MAATSDGTSGRIFSETETLVTKDQLAERLSLSKSYINQLMVEEGLPYFKIGRAVRYQPSEVLKWLNRRRRP